MKAVHIEVVPKLDTDSCLNAIMTFIARRDKPSASSVTTGQTLLELKENLQSTLRHGTKKGSKNI